MELVVHFLVYVGFYGGGVYFGYFWGEEEGWGGVLLLEVREGSTEEERRSRGG